MANIFYTTYQWIIDSFGSGYSRTKDANGNDVALANRTKGASNQGAMLIAGANDEYSTTLRVDRLGNVLTGNAQIAFADYYGSAVINVVKWTATSTNFVQAQTLAGGLNMASTAVVTANSAAIQVSTKKFPKLARVPLQMKSRVRLNLVANSIFEVGFGVPVNITAIINDGAFWRVSGTTAIPYISFGSTEQAGSSVDLSALMAANAYLVYDVIVDDDSVLFTIQDSGNQIIYSQSVNVQQSWGKMWQVTHQSCFHRLWQGSAPATAPTAIVTDTIVLMHDMNLNRSAGELAALLTLCGDQVPDNVTLNTNYANSTIPTSATLSNTVAGYTTLGGQWQFTAVAGAETDYCLFGYTVPAGYTMFVDAIRIEAFNMGAAVATTPSTLQWAMAHDSTAVSLATANMLKRALGTMSAAIAVPIGGRFDNTIDTKFATPVKTEGGRFFCVIVKCPVGTATASQIIRGVVSIDARFE